jgi:hypothetical protein
MGLAQGGRLFLGAAVLVTKIVQRTFEFITDEAAAEAMDCMCAVGECGGGGGGVDREGFLMIDEPSTVI